MLPNEFRLVFAKTAPAVGEFVTQVLRLHKIQRAWLAERLCSMTKVDWFQRK
jgi:hypothetical protein